MITEIDPSNKITKETLSELTDEIVDLSNTIVEEIESSVVKNAVITFNQISDYQKIRHTSLDEALQSINQSCRQIELYRIKLDEIPTFALSNLKSILINITENLAGISSSQSANLTYLVNNHIDLYELLVKIGIIATHISSRGYENELQNLIADTHRFLEDEMKQINSKNARIDELVEKFENKISKTVANMESVVEKAKKDAKILVQKSATDLYAGEFEEYSRKYSNQANKWMFAVFFFILVTFLASMFQFISFEIGFDLPFISNAMLSETERSALRFVIFVMLSYSIYFTGKNYSIAKNNQLIYEQKHKMMKVYIPFINTFDAGIKRDDISVELAKILFEIRGTGYVKNDGGSDDRSPNIFNIMDKFS